MLLTTTPKIVDDLVARLIVKVTDDGYTDILAELNTLGKIYFFNLPYRLNKLLTILKEYPDSNVETLVNNIGKIYWSNYYLKLADLVELTEVIELV